MDSLTIFGLFAVTAMLVFYALEERNTFYILCFAGACALGSIYGRVARQPGPTTNQENAPAVHQMFAAVQTTSPRPSNVSA